MEEENTTTLYFYPSKIKNIFFIIMGIAFIVGGIAVCFVAFKDGDYVISLIGLFLAILFSWLIFMMLKRMIADAPYLVLTEEELIINPAAKNSVPIKWTDVEGYKILRVQFNKFIEIILDDEEKYKEQMSKTQQKLNIVGTMGGKYSLFAIAWTQIKRKDRDVLLYALDYIGTPDFDLENATSSELPDELTQKPDTSFQLEDKINQEYFMKNYLLSLILGAFALLLFYWDEGNMSSLTYIIVSFILFPFAKLLLDVIVGFKLRTIMEKQTYTIYYVYQLIYLVYFLLFLFSLFVAPIGILFLIGRALYYFFQGNNE